MIFRSERRHTGGTLPDALPSAGHIADHLAQLGYQLGPSGVSVGVLRDDRGEPTGYWVTVDADRDPSAALDAYVAPEAPRPDEALARLRARRKVLQQKASLTAVEQDVLAILDVLGIHG